MTLPRSVQREWRRPTLLIQYAGKLRLGYSSVRKRADFPVDKAFVFVSLFGVPFCPFRQLLRSDQSPLRSQARAAALSRHTALAFVRLCGVMYLFQCCASPVYALSADKTGANIVPFGSFAPWLLRAEVTDKQLAAHFSDAIETINDKGYCLLAQEEAERVE